MEAYIHFMLINRILTIKCSQWSWLDFILFSINIKKHFSKTHRVQFSQLRLLSVVGIHELHTRQYNNQIRDLSSYYLVLFLQLFSF